ncbi:hypothetical protein TRFO_25023 [Tritrichomonas foetus]|uniref:Pre-mRNA-splicing factor SYF2 n=1 Tax=Tritrichomonas foetus TaxID=1144522 RepID=A0A1J4K6P2_9EUKA|nr:hypothetical protein TRFO_25023 [Tritrichomonas foetus]|eukprot:OHT06851.1 hypothetical protein TRFO_25023 [Tritrichomonas foetus]
MDEDREDLLRRLQLRINEARHLNNLAASDELAEEHQIKKPQVTQEEIFDIPIFLLKRNAAKTAGPTSEDHLQDPDIAYYLREIKKVPKSVYQDYQDRKMKGELASKEWKPRQEVVDELADRLITKTEKLRARNKRAANYDISGITHIDFINDHNKRFNRKLARDFDEYTADVRMNMERGGNV